MVNFKYKKAYRSAMGHASRQFNLSSGGGKGNVNAYGKCKKANYERIKQKKRCGDGSQPLSIC